MMTQRRELTFDGVGKQYRGGHWGVQDIRFALGAGVTGLLGPNGAGKTTLMRAIATLEAPTTGRLLWNGIPYAEQLDEVRAVVGYLPQDFATYPRLSAAEFLLYLAAAKGLHLASARRRIDELLDRLNLSGVAQVPLGRLSGGMRQRVGIAQALLNDPAILVIDEPTAGLDPEERVRLRHLIAEVAGARVVVLSTHIVSDIEATASRIVIMDRGRMRWMGTPEEMVALAKGRVWEWVIEPEQLADVTRTHRLTGTVRRSDGMHMRAVADEPPHPSATSADPRMEDAYMWCITGMPDE
jgi:ABC-type multidrug transport system ATPase subunit